MKSTSSEDTAAKAQVYNYALLGFASGGIAVTTTTLAALASAGVV